MRNYKCFESLDVHLAPLTILTGYNASGKSSTLQSVLLLAQALRLAGDTSLLPLNGPLVSLGTVGDVSARHGKGPLKFAFSGAGGAVSWSFEPQRNEDGRYFELRSFQVDGSDVDRTFSPLARNGPRDHPLIDTLRDVVFLGATRQTVGDAYPSPAVGVPVQADVGQEGQYAPWLYSQTADDKVDEARAHPAEERTTIRGQIDAWLNELFPGVAVNADQLAGTSLAKLEFKMGRSGGWIRPANTGYGLSYAFPVLVALVNARPGQLVIIDSPEAHLHPRAQSTMGRILGWFAAAGIQVVVETHSDHVLSGVRLSIKRKRIAAASVAIHFFASSGGDASPTVSPLYLDEDASLSDWPDGFFDQSIIDLAQLS